MKYYANTENMFNNDSEHGVNDNKERLYDLFLFQNIFTQFISNKNNKINVTNINAIINDINGSYDKVFISYWRKYYSEVETEYLKIASKVKIKDNTDSFTQNASDKFLENRKFINLKPEYFTEILSAFLGLVSILFLPSTLDFIGGALALSALAYLKYKHSKLWKNIEDHISEVEKSIIELQQKNIEQYNELTLKKIDKINTEYLNLYNTHKEKFEKHKNIKNKITNVKNELETIKTNYTTIL